MIDDCVDRLKPFTKSSLVNFLRKQKLFEILIDKVNEIAIVLSRFFSSGGRQPIFGRANT